MVTTRLKSRWWQYQLMGESFFWWQTSCFNLTVANITVDTALFITVTMAALVIQTEHGAPSAVATVHNVHFFKYDGPVVKS